MSGECDAEHGLLQAIAAGAVSSGNASEGKLPVGFLSVDDREHLKTLGQACVSPCCRVIPCIVVVVAL